MRFISWLAHCFIALPLAISTSQQAIGDHQQQQPLQLDEPAITSSPLLSLHRDLVEIESISGNEHHVAKYLQRYLKDRNYTVELQEVVPLKTAEELYTLGHTKTRYNVFAYPGQTRSTRVLVSSHIDTVPPYWPYEVWEHNEIWGRGSVDAKGSVAAQITAIEDLRTCAKIKEGDVSLVFVVGEEVGGDGMRAVNKLNMEWETAIFGEPTELKLASGHKGYLGLNIKATGKAGHSGYPWLGESANAMLIPVLATLLKLELPSSEKYGNTTMNIGRMQGGIAGNVIAETAKAQVTLRVAAGSISDLKKIVIDAINRVDERIEVEFSDGAYGPVYIDSDVKGFENMTVNYGTDIPNLKGDFKRYLYGPGSILVAHSDHEHLSPSDLEKSVQGYKTLILEALKS